MVKVYFRNPQYYIEQLRESGHRSFSWDYGSFARKSIDPLRYLSMMLGNAEPWELLVIAVEGAPLYNNTSPDMDTPRAVYPTWQFADGIDLLIDYCENDVGKDIKLSELKGREKRFRPVLGQDHVIVISDVPNVAEVAGRNRYSQILSVIRKYRRRGVKFVVHDTSSFRVMFGGDFDAASHNASYSYSHGNVDLPNGAIASSRSLRPHTHWIHLLGFRLAQLAEDGNAILAYNIQATLWAAENFAKSVQFILRTQDEPDVETPAGQYGTNTPGDLVVGRYQRLDMQPGDGLLCDVCSVKYKCRLYREGAVCALSKTEGANLASAFSSRDADRILDGLSKLAEIQATRLQKDLDKEVTEDLRFPETDKRIKDLFDSGVKIAKLRKPELNGKGVQVNVGVVNGVPQVSTSSPAEILSNAVRALEDRGVRREDITEDAIIGLLEATQSRSGQRALEEVIDAEIEDGD